MPPWLRSEIPRGESVCSIAGHWDFPQAQHVAEGGHSGERLAVWREKHPFLAALVRAANFVLAIRGGYRCFADDKHKGLGRIDSGIKLIEPFLGRLDTFEVHSRIAVSLAQRVVESPGEAQVLSRIADKRPRQHYSFLS